ncbi:endonuclease V [PVC group bacterium]|nr:endonuclease V [PVC group bacterium]
MVSTKKYHHVWDLTTREAKDLQVNHRSLVILTPPKRPIRRIAACDVSFSRHAEDLYAGVAVFSYPDLRLLDKATAKVKITFPYVPGYLSFRETPAVLEAFKHIKIQSDCIILDGQGLAHPRFFGLACHVGLWMNCPTIGCAKSRLIGEFVDPDMTKGSSSPLKIGFRTVGAVLRTRSGVKPLFVSPGHLMDISTAKKIILSLCIKYRIPEPIRYVHDLVNAARRREES